MTKKEEIKILIVEDELNTREALRRYFSLKYKIDCASDGFDAITKLQEENYDLILTDLRMPKADGMSVLDAAKGKAMSPECIMITAYGGIEDAVTAVKKGAFDFVTKPIKLEVLDKAVENALKHRKELYGKLESKMPNTNELKNAENIVMPQNNILNPMKKVFEIIKKIAPAKTTVLLSGESGTGKEVIARLIHDNSNRTGFFIPIHCAALTSTLIESELFGYEKGAFTGATERKKGKFELADKGTIFLDEIGEIDAATQVKLLRVLESRSFERVGGTESIKVDVRLIAATNRNLRQMVEDKTFREDLFYRLSVLNLELPPLRERKEDIPTLIDKFLKEFAKDNAHEPFNVNDETMQRLINYPWPGNIRELRNAIEYMTVLSKGNTLTNDDLPEFLSVEKKITSSNIENLEDNEKKLIIEALDKCNNNRTHAAKMLGISRRTLLRKIDLYELNI